MAKQAKPKIREITTPTEKVARAPVKHVRCYCGTQRLRGTSCPADHEELAKATGRWLLENCPQLRAAYGRNTDTYTGPPWTLKKLKSYRKLHADMSTRRTLERRVECPHCRTQTSFSQLTFSGCQQPGCVGGMP